MNTRPLLAALSGLLVAGSAHSAIVSTSLNNVMILGNAYNVTFWQDDSGQTTFDQIAGLAPSLGQTFEASHGQAAATELLAAANAAGFDTTPGGPASVDVFSLDYGVTGNTFTEYTGWRSATGSNGFVGVFGPFNLTRTQFLNASFATFAPIAASVPEPGTLALAVVGLAGLAAARRRVLFRSSTSPRGGQRAGDEPVGSGRR